MYLKVVNSVRTNNFTDKEMGHKIQSLWKYNQKVITREYNKGNHVYAVYHSYASNYKGDYTLSLCVKTDKNDYDFNTDEVNLKSFEVDTSKINGIYEAWKNIWNHHDKNRAYKFDFEEYYPNGRVVIKLSY